MPLTPIKTPLFVKKMFPNYVWDITTNTKSIYLTFDDGPTPEITNWVLNMLKSYHAKATFFCIGNNIEKHPEIFQNIIADGHSIGNHTHNHIKGWKTKANDYVDNIAKAESLIDSQIQNSELRIQNLFRPPYGQITPKQGKKLLALGYKIIMWDVLSFDWDKNVSEETCFNNVISKATNGSIIVFHDSVKASKNLQYTLPRVLEFFSKKNFLFEALPQKNR
ncbi:polysaccharide deacetylase family protein [Mariniflexile maritimum]|uniref:polysaccharide deacetylase family protein n=1 Tax=Mariniflexile maritimum TaxID=2682493 RepID=UPI0012F65B78|nr:polysaccharide deacetylase family protein [Mariniflexile maritimum]